MTQELRNHIIQSNTAYKRLVENGFKPQGIDMVKMDKVTVLDASGQFHDFKNYIEAAEQLTK